MSHDPRMTEQAGSRSSTGQRETAPPQSQARFELSIPRVMAGALAAASAAVAASWLGLAGTVLGAVVASVVVSVSTAIYTHPIERSSQVLRETLPVLPERYRTGDFTSGSTESTWASTQRLELSEGEDLEDHGVEPSLTKPRETEISAGRTRRINWGAVGASSAITLLAGFGILTGVEALLGQPASSLTGSDSRNGTTLSRLVEHDPAPTTPSDAERTPTVPDESVLTNSPDDPAPTEPEPTDPNPTETTQAEPTELQPTEPEPTEPESTEPELTQSVLTSPTGNPVAPESTNQAEQDLTTQ